MTRQQSQKLASAIITGVAFIVILPVFLVLLFIFVQGIGRPELGIFDATAA